jgi:sodium/potassium-transporting ATPase subunit alpha
MFIRDMNPAVKNPTNLDDGLFIYMKGAPERILSRCTKILINGEDRDYNEFSELVTFANDSFGKMGERVLAFARCKLHPDVYSKNPAYNFDIKSWKKW